MTDGEPRGRGDGGQGNVAGCSPDQGGNSPDSDFDSCDGSVDIVTAATTRPNYYKQDSSGNVSQVGLVSARIDYVFNNCPINEWYF